VCDGGEKGGKNGYPKEPTNQGGLEGPNLPPMVEGGGERNIHHSTLWKKGGTKEEIATHRSGDRGKGGRGPEQKEEHICEGEIGGRGGVARGDGNSK